MLNFKSVTLIVVALLALSGCASSLSGAAYTRDQARQVQDIRMAVVESVRNIQIEGTKTPIGATAGTLIGGVAGGSRGGRNASQIGAVLGGVIGGLAGAAAEEGLTRQSGYEITVRFVDNGKLIAVAQAADEKFDTGDRVRVITGGGATRISH